MASKTKGSKKKEPKIKKEKKEPKIKKEKKIPKLKVYCGVNDIPPRHRMGDMKECADAGQIRYYGLHKVDKLVLKSSLKVSEKEEKNLRVKLAGLKGTTKRLIEELKKAKTDKKKEEIKQEYAIIKRQFNNILDKLGKIEEKRKKELNKK